MRVVIDTLGSDNPAEVIVEGGIAGAEEYKVDVIFIGNERQIKKYTGNKYTVYHADSYISMEDKAVKAIKSNPNASIAIAMHLIKQGKADAVFSPGNTGATMAAALFFLGRLKGVKRPAIAIPIPRYDGGTTVLIDAGANVYVKPEYLIQFAYMGEAYYREIFAHNIKPKIGILSNGEEETKGTEITQKAYKKLAKSNLNFIGYVEGRDVFGTGKPVDVIVTDGFTGNIVLKTAEGLSKTIFSLIKDAINTNWRSKLGALLMYKSLKSLKHRFDHESYGGAPLLGVNGICIIGHGSSTQKAVKNAVRVAKDLYERKVNQQIMDHIHNA